MKGRNIGIIGGGIAGNALAILLSKAGFFVDVLEKLPNPGPVGSGIMLQPPAVKTLELLGLKEPIVKNGYYIKGFQGQNSAGKQVLDFEFESVSQQLYGLGVHRGSIFSNLNEEVKQHKNISLHFGAEVVDVTEKYDGVCVDIADGSSHKYDLVVVANGSGSMLRDLFSDIVTRAKPQNFAALWTTLPINDSISTEFIYHRYHKSEHMFGLMPIGYATNDQLEDPLVNYFCAITRDFFDDWDASKFARWKEHAYKVAPNYAQFTDQITAFDQMVPTPYFDAKLNPFYSGRVAFIGDACHALSPHLSAGTNLALLDALELSKALIAHENYQDAYQQFYKARKQQVNYYYFISRLITPVFQSPINISWVRDYIIPMLYRVPWAKQMMVETIAGVRQNMWSRIDEDYYI